MGSLHNKKLKDTYHGVIHTEDEGPINDTWKALQDGDGNPLPVQVKMTGMKWSGTQDFTNATIIGGGTSGTSGTAGTSGTSGAQGPQGPQGPTEILNDGPKATIWTNMGEQPDGTQYGVTNIAANFAGVYMPQGVQNSIGIGYYGACFNNSIYLGHYGQAADNSVVIGHNSYASSTATSVIGNFNQCYGQADGSLIYGTNNILAPNDGNGSALYSILIGSDSQAYGDRQILVGGGGASLAGDDNIMIGYHSQIFGIQNCSINTSDATTVNGNNISGTRNTVIGRGNIVQADDASVIGHNNNVTANGATAIGNDLTAATPDTLTAHKLQLVDWATTDFADDTAAATAGIPLGGVYHTAGILKIRIS